MKVVNVRIKYLRELLKKLLVEILARPGNIQIFGRGELEELDFLRPKSNAIIP